MATVFHLSDLHFGALDAPVAAALTEYVCALREREPGGVLVVSGDFTQRARPWQYREAMAWVEGLGFGARRLFVAGNHDVPLWAFWERFVSPLGRYRRFVTAERSPVWEDEGLMIVGVTTPRAWVPVRDGFWKDGRIGRRDLAEAVRAARRGKAAGKAVVVVTHHPFLPAPGTRRGGVVLGGVRAAEELADAGVDVLLAGHLHASYHGTVGVGHAEGQLTPGVDTGTDTAHGDSAVGASRVTRGVGVGSKADSDGGDGGHGGITTGGTTGPRDRDWATAGVGGHGGVTTGGVAGPSGRERTTASVGVHSGVTTGGVAGLSGSGPATVGGGEEGDSHAGGGVSASSAGGVGVGVDGGIGAAGGRGAGGILSVQAGTATSVRRRHDPAGREYANAFNVLRISAGVVEIEVHAWGGATSGGWRRVSVSRYRRGRSGAWEAWGD